MPSESSDSPSMDRDEVTDHNALILWRLNEQDKKSEEYRQETKATLGRIFEQVTRTNGRIASLEASRTYMKGILTAFGLVLTAIGTLVTWYVTYRGGHP